MTRATRQRLHCHDSLTHLAALRLAVEVTQVAVLDAAVQCSADAEHKSCQDGGDRAVNQLVVGDKRLNEMLMRAAVSHGRRHGSDSLPRDVDEASRRRMRCGTAIQHAARARQASSSGSSCSCRGRCAADLALVHRPGNCAGGQHGSRRRLRAAARTAGSSCIRLEVRGRAQ